jgi:type II secretory pathway pseudopilin PulG
VRPPSRQARGEGGFTLTELIAVVGIISVVGFLLTEAVIVGFKTTDATANDISRSTAVQALQSFFTGDAQSAKQVSRADPGAPCAPTPGGVFLHMSWTDRDTERDVSYSLEEDSPPIEGERELVRWSCIAGGPADKRMLGRFTSAGTGLPVVALCDGAECPVDPTTPGPATITLKVLTNRPREADDSAAPAPGVELTVRRRTT